MKLTNNKNLPEPIVIAAQAFDIDYTSGRRKTDYSVTELLRDPLLVQLKRRHYDEIVEDISDRLWAIDGSAWHKVVEMCKSPKYIAEKRFFLKVKVVVNGEERYVLISGQADLYRIEDMRLFDYKNTSLFKVKKRDKNVDWVGQLNILGYLAEINGLPVRSLAVVAKSKDWRRGEYSKAKESGRDYPEYIEEIEIPKYPLIKTRKRLEQLVQSHVEAEGMEIKDIPQCSDTWGGRKCKDYCAVNKFCPYYEKGVE